MDGSNRFGFGEPNSKRVEGRILGISNLDNTKLVATQQEKGYVRCINRGTIALRQSAAPYLLIYYGLPDPMPPE